MEVLRDEPMARQGYWRVGGPMDRFVVVEQPEELAELLAGPGPIHVLGRGSNLLVPDAGLRGTTLRLGRGFAGVEERAAAQGRVRVRLGAGLSNVVALQRLSGRLRGLAPLAGVPGSIGGAVAMNAGTALGEIERIVVAVEGVDAAGPRRIERADLPMRYREGGLPEGFLVTAVEVELHEDGVAEEQAAVRHHLDRRKATQPLDLPSCGSVFRNPPGDAAGRLIESVGLKGARVGGAEISERHANFIVNRGGATAADVLACIRLAWDTVRAERGVTLVPEVHVLGEWGEAWPLSAGGRVR